MLTLEALAAREAMRDKIYLICAALDRAEPDRLADAFHPDASILVGPYDGDIPGFIEMIRQRQDAVVRAVHMIGNVLIRSLGPDRAFAESYCQAIQEIRAEGGPNENQIVRLRYADAFVARDGDWRILRRVIVVDHSLPATPAASVSLFRGPQGTRGEADPSRQFESALARGEWPTGTGA